MFDEHGAFDRLGSPVKEIIPPVKLRPLKEWTTIEYLPNGHCLFANAEQTLVFEIDARGELVWQSKGSLGKFDSIAALRNGHLLLGVRAQPKTAKYRLAEVNRGGKVLWEATYDMMSFGRHHPCFDVLRLRF